jgi:hypothetical protein
MRKILSLFLTISTSVLLTSCGMLENKYRYPCHDPANWYNKECNPPICQADGLCTKDILGFDPVEGGVNE